MTGAPEGSPKVVLCGFMGFLMEKPGIEPATPGLQGIELIHYTTGAHIIDNSTNTIFYYCLLHKKWQSITVNKEEFIIHNRS